MTVLVGGVGELYQGDLDLGRVAVERLSGEDLGDGVIVEDFFYGAVAVAQRLEELRPDGLVLVAGVERGHAPGTVTRRSMGETHVSTDDFQGAVVDAVTGYVTVDLVLRVAAGLQALPQQTVAIEVEPASKEPSEHLSPAAEAGLEEALALVRTEVRGLGAGPRPAPGAGP